jgi:hypothetical protein
MKANAPLWIVSLGQGGGDAAAVGGPGAPVITNPEGGPVIKFTAGEEGAAGPTLGYGATIEPEGPTLTIDAPDPTVGGEVVVTDTEAFTDYVVTIYGVNVAGRGKAASTNPFQVNYNLMTGGTITHIDDYRGTGKRYQIHLFTGGSVTVDVQRSPNDYEVLIVKPGGKGGQGGGGGASGGGGGQGTEYLAAQIATGSQTVNPAAGSISGLSGSPTWTKNGGGGGGPAAGEYQKGGSGGPGYGSQVGTWPTTTKYGGGGGGGSNTIDGTHWGGDGRDGGGRGGHGGSAAGGGTRGGGGGGGAKSSGGGDPAINGAAGSVGWIYVCYEVAPNTRTEIEQAHAMNAAREEGHATGYDVGLFDGRVERDAEMIEVEQRALAEKNVEEAKPKRSRKKAD